MVTLQCWERRWGGGGGCRGMWLPAHPARPPRRGGKGKNPATSGFWLTVAPAWRRKDGFCLHVGPGRGGWGVCVCVSGGACQSRAEWGGRAQHPIPFVPHRRRPPHRAPRRRWVTSRDWWPRVAARSDLWDKPRLPGGTRHPAPLQVRAPTPPTLPTHPLPTRGPGRGLWVMACRQAPTWGTGGYFIPAGTLFPRYSAVLTPPLPPAG